ncbi:MAG: outer membrane beta-barrel protein, partial [Bacteroidota bacterium]|nr:outer membrane beta-barrel protein [Bacteroidota bacterium]
IEYNPEAFKMQPGAVVEDLLKRINGVEIDSEGKITVAGKEVKKVYVDGKQFFGNDPTMATKNLTTDIIDRIQVVDKKSDLALLTGIDDGESETVINLTIKKGMKKGWMVNAEGGLGHEVMESDNGTRYQSRAMVNRFLNDSQLSFIENANNINERGSRDWGSGFGQQMGRRGGGMSAGNGITTSDVFGTNFATELNKKLKIGGSAMYNHFNTDAKTRSSTQKLFQDSTSFVNSTGNNINNSNNLNVQMRMEYTPDSSWAFVFTPSFSYNKSHSESESTSATLAGEIRDSINSKTGTYISDADGISLSGQLDMSYQFKKKGRRLSMSLSGGYNNSDGVAYNISQMIFQRADSISNLDQQINNSSESKNYRLYASYMEPLRTNRFLQLSYSISRNITQSDKMTYSRDALSELYNVLDTAYSKSLSNNFINQQLGLSFRATEATYSYTIGVDLQPSYSKSKSYVEDKVNFGKERSVMNYSPNLNYTYRFSKQQNLRIDYRGRTSQPSITQLDPTPDNSNPLNIKLGNPDLLPTYSNNISARYNDYNREAMRSIMATIQGGFVVNDIINKSTYDANTGAQITRPVNENGNWNMNAGLMFNTPIGKSKFQVNTFTNASFNNSIGYLSIGKGNIERNISQTLSLNENLGLSYRNDFIYAQIRGNIRYSKVDNSVTARKGQENMSYGSSFNTQIYLPYSFTIASDLRYTGQSGLSTGYNKNETMWNAEISKQILNKKGTIRFKLNDILRQQLNINRSVSDIAITDTQYNTLTSYYMISFNYRFNTMGNRSSNRNFQHPDGGFPGGGRGGFPGGGRPDGPGF